ncbi:MAG: hypothetical protein DRJ42_03360 [Deltaproteobacteria bacterium]|nr:MAG: hypothetical protein DRJ42_03360 [Deltaproteobacteria bacterium]
MLVGLGLGAASACEVTQGYDAPTASGDSDDWAMHVQPYVARRCATLDCHGDPGRPLRIYSTEGLRDGEDRAAPLTASELDENVLAALGVSPFGDAATHALILVPLAPSSGGWHHVGGDIWASRDDPGYQCLSRWLAGADSAASCATAAANVPRGLP